MVIDIVELVMVDIKERWVVVTVRGSRWHWGEGGQHWSCMGWTCLLGVVVVMGRVSRAVRVRSPLI